MKIVFENENHQNILFMDGEYDREDLRQISGVLFSKREDGYELKGSINLYIKDSEELNQFFITFTGITNDFIDEYGISLKEAVTLFNEFISDSEDLLIVGHNLNSDSMILFKNGINIDKYDNYCTWKNAKELLPNNEHYTVTDLAQNEGFFMFSPHDSFCDAWALVPIFCKLKELENENKSN